MVANLASQAKAPDRVHPDLSKKPNRFPASDTVLMLAGKLAEAEANCKAANKAKKTLRKQLENAGQGMEAFDTFKKVIDHDDPAEALVKFMDEMFHLAETFYMLPKGTQVDFFTGPKNQEDILQKARQMGYMRGIMGQNPDEQAYPPNTNAGQEHMAGWYEGQEKLQKEFVSFNERVAKEAAEKKTADEAKAKKAEDEAAAKKKKAEDAAWKAAQPKGKKKNGAEAGSQIKPAE